MTITLRVILLLLAFVLFVLAGLGVPNPPPRLNLTALGLALVTLAQLTT